MTVIVYRGGVMAADTGGFMGDILASTDEIKIRRTSQGHLVGCAGKLPSIERFHEWASGGFIPDERPKDIGDFGALTVAPDGTITKYDEQCFPYSAAGPWGIEGCAEEFLTGALAMGATAEEAVSIAIKHCVWAAGRVFSHEAGGLIQ